MILYEIPFHSIHNVENAVDHAVRTSVDVDALEYIWEAAYVAVHAGTWAVVQEYLHKII